jgi:hypothetical protein
VSRVRRRRAGAATARAKRGAAAKRAATAKRGSGAARTRRASKERAGVSAATPSRKEARGGSAARKPGAATKGTTKAAPKPTRAPAAKRASTAKRARRPAPAAKRTSTAKRARRPAPPAKRAARPALRVVKNRVPPPPPFAGATAGASVKELALFELVRARVAFTAAIQGLEPASAERPTAPGKWSPREMTLHLAYWDREVLRHLEAAWRDGIKMPFSHDDVLERNPIGVAELSHHDWESAKRLLQANRERLVEALQSIPEEPAGMWGRGHPLGDILRILTHHDRHHADAIKAARAAGGR